MKKLKIALWSLLGLLVLALAFATWQIVQRQPQRSGSLALNQLTAPVTVAYDERGVPHIQASNEADLYRALGYVHAQDRLFQMEVVRRLAKGELAEVLGPKLLDTDKLFRTLGIRQRADEYVSKMDMKSPANASLLAYIDGINQYQDTHPAPLEFAVLGIPRRPFTPQDTIAVSGYLAYSFAAAFKTEPVMTFIRDKLGERYLKAFDIDWHPSGALPTVAASGNTLNDSTWRNLTRLAATSQSSMDLGAAPLLEGSNAWAISGQRTASGKPLLAGDPHIGFSAPSVWYEAHLSAPGFELYGHYQALNPVALLGHNNEFGWSLTMFQNDDIDLIAEKVNPANASQVWHRGQWVDMTTRTETIQVKGAAPVQLTLRRSPHGPIVTDAFADSLGTQPVAMWWAFLETDNPVLDAFYELNRANTRDKARAAASKIHAPGLNVVWANAQGDIGWWAAALLPRRPAGVNPVFILDAAKGEADKPGFYPFSANPQAENPAQGYIVSANYQPPGAEAVPGYYNLPDRGQRLDSVLSATPKGWTPAMAQALQLESGTAYGPRILKHVLPVLKTVVTDAKDQALLAQLEQWDGRQPLDSVAATVFNQLVYELTHAAMQDELGEVQFANLLRTRALDIALPRLVAEAGSPWWDNRNTPAVETRQDTLLLAWNKAIAHLQTTYGADSAQWTWGKAHRLTHVHPLGRQKPLNLLFNVGPFEVPGGREVPNNLSAPIGPAPWEVAYGPSTRRVIDFANPAQARGINPVGQSGVLFDKHYADQAKAYSRGESVPQHLSAADVKANTASTLTLQPQR